MGNLIYVFNEDDKNYLEYSGYILVKEDKRNNIYVFVAEYPEDVTQLKFSNINYSLSNTLTF